MARLISHGGPPGSRGEYRRALAPISPKKKTMKKKHSPPPSITRPGTPEEALAVDRMCLRPRQRSPPSEKKPAPVDDYNHGRGAKFVSLHGYTNREYQLCLNFARKQHFEYLDSVPEECKEFKAFLDTIRRTKGYGLTKHYFPLKMNTLVPSLQQYLKSPRLGPYIDAGVEVLLAKMEQELKTSYRSLGVANLVYAGACDTYLLTLNVEEEKGKGRTRSGRKPAFIVEALIYGGWSGPEPKNSDRLQVTEWKLKRGTQVLHCTEKITP